MAIEERKARSLHMFFGKNAPRALSAFICFDGRIGERYWPFWRKFNDVVRLFMPRCLDVSYEKRKLGGQNCLVAVPKKLTDTSNVILYIHGGGFVNGSAMAAKSYLSMLASYSGCRAIACDYRLAPEHPYPAGLEDCMKVYRAILKKYQGKIALVGESAGGNLVLAAAFRAMQEGLEKPASVSAHSPITDLSMTLERTDHKIRDFTVKLGCLPVLKEIYAGEHGRDVGCSPYFGEYAGFPPLFITCDKQEMLETDAVDLYKKAAAAGVPVRFIRLQNAFHAFAVMGTLSPESKRILKENIAFIKGCFRRNEAGNEFERRSNETGNKMH